MGPVIRQPLLQIIWRGFQCDFQMSRERWVYLKIGYRDSSPNNGQQSDMP